MGRKELNQTKSMPNIPAQKELWLPEIKQNTFQGII